MGMETIDLTLMAVPQETIKGFFSKYLTNTFTFTPLPTGHNESRNGGSASHDAGGLHRFDLYADIRGTLIAALCFAIWMSVSYAI